MLELAEREGVVVDTGSPHLGPDLDSEEEKYKKDKKEDVKDQHHTKFLQTEAEAEQRNCQETFTRL